MPKRNDEEHQIQCGIIDWYDLRYGDEMLMAYPAGGARSAATGARLKREGVRKGVWDLFLAVPMLSRHGMWIEVKIPSKRSLARGGLTKEQEEFGRKAQNNDYHCIVVYTTQEGIDRISWYLRARKNNS